MRISVGTSLSQTLVVGRNITINDSEFSTRKAGLSSLSGRDTEARRAGSPMPLVTWCDQCWGQSGARPLAWALCREVGERGRRCGTRTSVVFRSMAVMTLTVATIATGSTALLGRSRNVTGKTSQQAAEAGDPRTVEAEAFQRRGLCLSAQRV